MSCGEMIFEMLVRCCDVLKIHYDLLLMNNLYQSEGDKKFKKRKTRHDKRIKNAEKFYNGTNINLRFPANGGLLIEKIVTIIEQTMNIFCLADNSYKAQFNAITAQDLEDYINFKKQIKNKSFGNFFGENSEEINNAGNNKIYELKNNIENSLYELFDNYSVQITSDIHDRIIEYLDNFINDTHDIFRNLSSQVKPKNKNNNGFIEIKLLKKLEIIFLFLKKKALKKKK